MHARRPRYAFLPALLLALTLALGAALAASRPAPSRAAADPVQVDIVNFVFTPQTLTVTAGTTVRWTNRDRAPHDVTSSANQSPLNSPLLGQGESFEFTFTTPGVYAYICSVHPYMAAEIRVVAASEASVTFPETGFTVRGAFLRSWQSAGLDLGDPGVSTRESLALFGYPLSEERRETLEDGQEYLVQYFERARFEAHPENQAPFDVLLGQFGRRLHPADPRATPLPGADYVDATGHNLGGRFRDFWQANGGLAIFGYPISEEFTETLEDNRQYKVQYFERARLEAHPESAAPYDVQLGQFGRRVLEGR